MAVDNFYEKSNLFALYDPTTQIKWLLYQQSDNTICLYNVESKSSKFPPQF
jgi:hypothetical protein